MSGDEAWSLIPARFWAFQLDGADIDAVRQQAAGAFVTQIMPVKVDLLQLRPVHPNAGFRVELHAYAEDAPSELASRAVDIWRRHRRHCPFPRHFVEKFTPDWNWLAD